jgi:hypothetical protein
MGNTVLYMTRHTTQTLSNHRTEDSANPPGKGCVLSFSKYIAKVRGIVILFQTPHSDLLFTTSFKMDQGLILLS